MLSNLKYTPENHQVVYQLAKSFYDKIGDIFCPYFKEKVHFGYLGWRHLFFKGKKGRSKLDQFMRLKLLDISPKVISQSHTLQELEHLTRIVDNQPKKVMFSGFIAIFESKKVKVILRKVGNGKLEFYSLIPFWQTTIHGDIKFMDLATGDLEND